MPTRALLLWSVSLLQKIKSATHQWQTTARIPTVTLDHRACVDTLPFYMYFQTMATHHHSLEQSRPPHMKLRAHLSRTDAYLIKHEVAIMPQKRLSYSANNLTNKPHGLSPARDKIRFDQALERYRIPHITVNNGSPRGLVNLVNSLGMFGLYPNYAGYRTVKDIDGEEDALLHHALSSISTLVNDESRGGQGGNTFRSGCEFFCTPQ